MADDDALLFEARKIYKTFKGKKVLQVERLQIRRGKMTAIVGASGSGKTTLLNILGGLDQPDPGATVSVWLDGEWRSLDSDALRLAMAEDASYAFQQGHLLANASLRLNLRLASRGRARQTDIEVAFARARLAGDLQDEPGLLAGRTWRLSGGQSQRLNIARAYVRQPSIVFADEPSSNLDPENARHVILQLKGWLQQAPDERTVVMVTHDYGLATIADDLIVLAPGGELRFGGATPERAPESAEEIRKLAETGAAAPGIVGPEPAAGRKRSGAFAGLRDAVTLAWQETFAASAGTGRLSAFSPRRFRPWPSLGTLSLLILLLVGLLYVQGYAQAYFDAEMADPRVRYEIISGNPLHRDETQLSPALLEELKERPRFPSLGLFPRVASDMTLMPPEDDEKAFRQKNLRMLALKSEEDIAQAVPLLDVNGRPTGQTLAAALRAADKQSGQIAVALSKEYFHLIASEAGLSPEQLQQLLRLRGGGRRVPFEFIGLFDVQVPDRGYVYDGIMSLESYTNWALAYNSGWLDERGQPVTYQRLAVYFDINTYASTLSGLEKTNFNFSRDNFRKIARLFDVSLSFKRLLGALIVGVGLLGLALLVLDAWAQLTRVWKSALILLAHGVPTRIFALAVSTQVLIVLGLAALFSCALIYGAARLIGDGALLLVALHHALLWMMVGAVTTVVVVFSGARVTAPPRTALGEQLKSR